MDGERAGKIAKANAKEGSENSRAGSPLLGHSALRQLSSEGNDSRETCHSPFKAMGTIEGGEQSKVEK